MFPMPEDHNKVHRSPPPVSGWALLAIAVGFLALAYLVVR